MKHPLLKELDSVASVFGAYMKAAGLVAGSRALVLGAINARRDPFPILGPAGDSREKASREQAGIAVCIYRALLKQIPQEQALGAMGHLIEAGAIAFLMKTLPEVSAATLDDGTPETRWNRVQGWMDRFFTAESHVTEVTDTRVVLHVTACSLVRLVHAAGHPELGPLFCKGDLAFFEQRGITLTRPTRIAAGDAHCQFELQRS